MAAELECDYVTGRNVYFQVRNSVGQIWNTVGVAFEAYATGNIGDYDIAATEQGTASGFYTATMPTTTGGYYNVVAKERIGGSPAETDPTIATGQIEWCDGKILPTAMSIVASVVAGKISGAGTGTETFRGLDDSANRAVVTVDASGNRSAVTYP